MKKLLALILALSMVLALCACGGSSAPAATEAPKADAPAAEAPAEKEMPYYNFKFSVTQASTDPIAIFAQQMIDEIEEKSEGHIQIELHCNGELGSINDVNELIAQGAEIINYTGADAFNATVPNLAILNCQYCLSDPAQMKLVHESDWFKDQVETLAANGNVRMLSYNWFTGFRHFISKFPINTVEDLNGKQMRVADAAALIAFSKALGCSPVVTNWNETYTALSQGMVDCAEAPLGTLYSSSLQEVTGYLTMTGHLVSCGGIVMNEKIFASMPEEYQQIILDASWNAGEAFGQHSLGLEEEYISKFEEAGIEIIRIDDATLQGFIDKASAMYSDPTLGFPDGLFEQIQAIINP